MAREERYRRPVQARHLASRMWGIGLTLLLPQARRRRFVGRVVYRRLDDSSVLAPIARPEDDLGQGQHAADRLQRVPVVGQSTAKVAERMSARTDAAKDDRSTSASTSRRVAPRLFKSPLSHIRVMRSAKGGRHRVALGPTTERIVLQAPGDEPVSASTTERDAQRAGQERVQAAWNRAGRPLDWTDARIEVIQVPLMMGVQLLASARRLAPSGRLRRVCPGSHRTNLRVQRPAGYGRDHSGASRVGQPV